MIVSDKELLDKIKEVTEHNAINFDSFTIKGEDYGINGEANLLLVAIKDCLKWYGEKVVDRCAEEATASKFIEDCIGYGNEVIEVNKQSILKVKSEI